MKVVDDMKDMDDTIVRKVVRNNGKGSMRGYFASTKMKKSISCESKLELDAVAFLETCQEVIRYREQPTIIYFFYDGKMHKYFPDFEADVLKDGILKKMHIEVKPQKKLLQPDISKRFDAIEKHYKENTDIDLVVLTEAEIYTDNYANNVRLLNAHYHWEPSDPKLLEVVEKLEIMQPLTVGAANVILGNNYEIYRLIAAGVYTFKV